MSRPRPAQDPLPYMRGRWCVTHNAPFYGHEKMCDGPRGLGRCREEDPDDVPAEFIPAYMPITTVDTRGRT